MDGLFKTGGGKSYPLDASMSWMLAYERAFRADALSASLVLLGNLDINGKKPFIIAVLWSMIRNADPKVEAVDEWKHEVGEIEFEALEPVLKELIDASYKKTEKAFQERESAERENKITLMQIVSAGISRGLSLSDTKTLTLGMWLDYITAHNNLNTRDEDQDEPIRMATQADINKLKR